MLAPKKAIAYALLGMTLVACAPSAAPAPAPPPAATTASQPAAVPATPSAPANPVDAVEITKPVEVVLWHQLAGPREALLKTLVGEFQTANPNITIKLEQFPGYTQIDQKVMASIQAKAVPDLAHGYESMAAPYYDAKANVPFDDYISSKKYGLSDADLKDFVPSFLDATKFPAYDNKRLTFPWTKSGLTWYSNLEVLKAAGVDKSPATWDELATVCKKVVAAGKQCWGYNADASNIDGLVFTYGKDVVSKDGKKPAFDSPEAIKALKVFENMYKDKLIYLAAPADAQNDFVGGKSAFYWTSSTAVPTFRDLFKDPAKWSAGLSPHGTATTKATVLYGGNLIMMKTTPERQLAAWLFAKWFSSKEITTRWGIDPGTGYFPVRLSALADPNAKKMIDATPEFSTALDASKYGLVEPSVNGWQDMRTIIQDAVTGILTGKLTAEQASAQIQEKGTKALSGA